MPINEPAGRYRRFRCQSTVATVLMSLFWISATLIIAYVSYYHTQDWPLTFSCWAVGNWTHRHGSLRHHYKLFGERPIKNTRWNLLISVKTWNVLRACK